MKKSRTRRSRENKSLTFVENLKRQWMATVDAVPDPLMTISSDYRIKKANKAISILLKTPIRSLINQKCYRVFAGRAAPCDGCMLQRELTGEAVAPYELHVKNKKVDRYYEVSGMAYKEDDRTYALHVYRDVTRAKILQEQLIQSEKLASIGTLSGGFAHEINNPLGGILVFSQMALREMHPQSQHYKDIQEIENAAQRCKKIVDDLLAFARKSPPSVNMKEQPSSGSDVHEAIRAALEWTRLGFKGEKWYIHAELNANKSRILGDKQRLTQVFLNLFKNALQAMPKGGDLEVLTENPSGRNGFIRITVRDTGIGVPKALQTKIFDPFFTTKQPGEGTGLGLSIVYGIVKDMGGSISLKSTVKKGTSFLIELPILGAARG